MATSYAMITYHGEYSKEGCEIYKTDIYGNRQKLNPRHDLKNHSPDGFSWGYSGSGPAQSALAILADFLGDDLALMFYQQFKNKMIAKFDQQEHWTISQSDILYALGFPDDSASEQYEDRKAIFNMLATIVCLLKMKINWENPEKGLLQEDSFDTVLSILNDLSLSSSDHDSLIGKFLEIVKEIK